MYFLKTLLSPRSISQQESKVQEIFYKTKVHGSESLHPEYMKIVYHTLSKAQDGIKCLKLLIGRLETLSTFDEIIKCFTIIHHLMISNKYQGPILDCIQNAQIITKRQQILSQQKEYEQWFATFYKCFIRYLVKAASNSEILIRTTQQTPQMQPNMLIDDFFRLVNQLNIILVPFNNTIKLIGRYYSKKLKIFDELYRVLRIQLLNIYKYFRKLIDQIIKSSERLSLPQLQTFVIAVPQYQLMLDQLQDVLISKYFKGEIKYHQPHVLAQDIAKINYHIQCRKKSNQVRNDLAIV